MPIKNATRSEYFHSWISRSSCHFLRYVMTPAKNSVARSVLHASDIRLGRVEYVSTVMIGKKDHKTAPKNMSNSPFRVSDMSFIF